MTLREYIQVAAGEKDGDPVRAAVMVSDFCRFRLGMNYDQTYAVVREVVPAMTPARWDSILYEADTEPYP